MCNSNILSVELFGILIFMALLSKGKYNFLWLHSSEKEVWAQLFVAAKPFKIYKVKLNFEAFRLSEEWLGILYTKLLYLNLIGNALQCHQCDSSKDVKCILSFHSNSDDNMDFLKDCPDDGKNYTNCRIIYPSYNQYHIDIDTRIIRECGYKGDGWSKTYNEVFTANIKFFIYNCVEDGCNTGNEKWWLNNSNINQSSIFCIISILMVLLLNILIG